MIRRTMTKVALPGSQVLVLPKKKKKKIHFFVYKTLWDGCYATHLRKLPTQAQAHTHTHTHVLPRTQVVPAHARALAVAG